MLVVTAWMHNATEGDDANYSRLGIEFPVDAAILGAGTTRMEFTASLARNSTA